MKTANKNGSNFKQTGISIPDCIHKIKSKFSLTEQEILQLNKLKTATISGVFLTEDGSFNAVDGEYFAENIEGNGKVCIKYYDNEPYPKFLTLKRIHIEKDVDLNHLYFTLENSVAFFEEAKRASKRIYFQRLFSKHQKQSLESIVQLNKAFSRSSKYKKTEAMLLSNQLLTLQRKGRNYVINRAINLENKMVQIICSDLKNQYLKNQNQVLLNIEEDLILSISELRNIQNNALLQ